MQAQSVYPLLDVRIYLSTLGPLLTPSIISRPLKVIQPPVRIRRKLHPSRGHIPVRPVLDRRVRDPGDILRRAKDHMQVDTVISPASRIESQIPKVAKVPRMPGRDAVCDAIGRRLAGRTGKRGQVELVPLLVGE
jgi:hypothetical protein